MSSPSTRKLLLPAAFYVLLSLACTQIPLLNYLGYEFSVLTAVVASVISGFTVIRRVKRAMAESGSSPAIAFRKSLVINLGLLTIPLVVMTANALFVKNCSLLEGLGFFLLIPVVSVVFSSALGFVCAAWFKRSRTVFGVFFICTFIYAASLGYFTPAIYSYNFFYGYFPGLTYDEAVGLTWTLVLFRLVTLALAVVCVAVASLLVRHTKALDGMLAKTRIFSRLLFAPGYRGVTIAVVVGFVLIYYFRCALGFESTAGYIQGRLGSSHSTGHFVIYYSGDSYSGDEIEWIGAEHEFRLAQLADALAIAFKGTIESYIYPSAESKQRLIGTGTTNIAKPWTRQIHITKQSLDVTLKHELVHVVAAPFGMPVIRASTSTGLVEGLAVALEWEWGNRTPHQYAAALRAMNMIPDIARLMRFTGFAAQASSISYVVSGSFCRYLIDQYGIRRMMQLYRSADYDAIYGKSLEELIAGWHEFLDRTQVTDSDRAVIDAFFRRPPIFQKVCARVVAQRNIVARSAFSDGNYDEAARLYQVSYDEGRGYEAFGGYLASELRRRNFTTVLSAYHAVIAADSIPDRYLGLFLTAGDAAWGAGDTARARDLYGRVYRVDLSQSYTEAGAVRLAAMNGAGSWLSYFLADASDSVRIAMLDTLATGPPWLARYLRGRIQLRLGQHEGALATLGELDLSRTNHHLEALRLRSVGLALFKLRRFEEAKVSFWLSLNYVETEVAQHNVSGWVERCEWMKLRSQSQ
jgi:tetratricopeptide (TPR) repeat protein